MPGEEEGIATSPSAISARTEAFRQDLRELDYVEGKNITIGGLSRENSMAFPRSWPSWCVSK
jgi:hypothetical protein